MAICRLFLSSCSKSITKKCSLSRRARASSCRFIAYARGRSLDARRRFVVTRQKCGRCATLFALATFRIHKTLQLPKYNCKYMLKQRLNSAMFAALNFSRQTRSSKRAFCTTCKIAVDSRKSSRASTIACEDMRRQQPASCQRACKCKNTTV